MCVSCSKMNNLLVILLFLNFLNFCVNFDNVWHSYHYDPIYESREELTITNITSDDTFYIANPVNKWKSLHVEDGYYLVGTAAKKITVVYVELQSHKKSFSQNSTEINLEQNVVDFQLLKHWNMSTQNFEIVLVVATQKPDLVWYKVNKTSNIFFWSWPVAKNISHISVFQLEYEHHLLIINTYLSQVTADLYVCHLDDVPNFWLRQKIDLTELSTSSAVASNGPDFFLAIPQKSLNLVCIYSLQDNHFIPIKNLSSRDVSEVVAFKVGHQSFLAINGFEAGIYKIMKKDFVSERIVESHLDGVNYWLPIPLTIYGDEAILIAQRSLKHEPHKSFVIEIITYNGDKFEEHEDISCFYFGESILGLSCLPDEERGIIGSTSIFLDGVLGLLVPRNNRPSDFFLVGVELKEAGNPVIKQIEDFKKRKNYINDLIEDQQKKYNILSSVRSRESVDFATVKSQLDQLEKDVNDIRENVDFLGKSPMYDTVIFNGVVKIGSDANFHHIKTQKINGEPADATFADLVLKNNISSVLSPKVFNELVAEDLTVAQVNGINASNLLFSSDEVKIKGNLFLVKPLTVDENMTTNEVNGILFEDEVINTEFPTDHLFFENLNILGNVTINNKLTPDVKNNQLNLETLSLLGNLEVDTINDENFTQFLWELCLKNIRNKIPGTVTVDGDVKIEEDAEIEYLNELKFPFEYVFVDKTFPNITGKKYFTSALITDDVKIDGTIDDIDTQKIITLSTKQNISGITTFKNLKITESLNVSGDITGEHASKFLPNPTLFETNSIKAKVNFKELQVDGAIFISENFNGQQFESILRDVVYKDEDKSVINAIKHFPETFTVRKNLLVHSNMINNVHLDSIVTKNTDQVLNITTINGVVNFDNVETDRLYDSVDINKLDEELVMLDGEQYISSTLIFEDEIDVNKLEIYENVTVLNPNMNQSDLEASLDNLDSVIVEGNLYGTIETFDLEEFDKSRMSYNKDQIIESDFRIEELFVENILPVSVNDVDVNDLTYEGCRQKILNKFLEGNLTVSNFHTSGSIELDKINNRSIIGLGGTLWKHDIQKHNLTTLYFRDDVYFNNVTIGNLSRVNFDYFIKNIVFKNDTDVKISGRKTFTKGYTVNKLIETQKLNNVSINNILTKHGEQEISGPITIQGDVVFENDVTVFGNLSNIPINQITDAFQESDDSFEINGDVLFSRLAHIHNLDIRGYVDDKNVEEFVNAITYIDEDIKLEGQTFFENSVNIEKNVRVTGRINNIDLTEFVSDMILISKDINIECPVKFVDSVVVTKEAVLQNGLKTQTINGITTDTWTDNAIFIDKGFLKGNYLFENVRIVDNLHTEYINNISTATLIPLRTSQNLSQLIFNEISLFKDVSVGNSTNYYNLSEEFANSVLTYTDEDIDSDVEFLGNVFIDGNLKLSGTLNGVGTNQIVTTNTEQELDGVYNFKSKTTFEGDLVLDGLINGIDVENWSNEAVRVSAKYPQNISSNWLIEHDVTLEDDCVGNGLINEINFEKFSQEVVDKRNLKYEIEKALIDDYTNMCKDLTYMYNKLKRQIYKFDYFDIVQVLDFPNKIQHVYNYKYQDRNYIFIIEKKNCETFLFMYDNNHFRFVKNIHFGLVDQIIFVYNNDLMYLVVRNQPFYSTCKVQGTNLWQLIDNDFVHLLNIEDQDLLQDSLVPGTFYGINGNTITEFKILPELDSSLRKYRKWEVDEDGENVAFVPRGFATGLALRTGRKLIRLHRDDPITDPFTDETENVIIIGNYTEEFNTFFPGRKGSDLIVMKVGIKSNKKSLLGVASREETSVKGSLDFIKIYEDAITGKVFLKLPTYKPSSLVSLDFNNGETLLIFMEDESVLQVYEYKGIEGFKHKSSAKLKGSKLFTLDMKLQKIVGVVDKNKITFMEAVMLGNQIADNLQCNL